MRVEDDGVGFEPDAPVARPWVGGGLGLLGMDERARSVGGTLTIVRRSGGGTLVEARVPLPDEPALPAARAG